MEQQNISININMQGKNMLVAYLLWWFLGWAGGHRFYLNRIGSGVTQLVLFLIGIITAVVVVGLFILGALWVWWLIDVYFTQKMVNEENAKLGIQPGIASHQQKTQVENELEQLEKLHALYKKGVLTEQEYEEKKALLL